MAVRSWIKDPAAVLDWSWDWSSWLEDGETITSQAVTVTSGDVTIGAVSQAAGVVTAWISGGTVGLSAAVDCTITTSSGRTDSRLVALSIRDR